MSYDPLRHWREDLNENERAVLELVRKQIVASRIARLTGKLTVEVDFNAGGVTDKWVTVRLREK